jgi:hypothetical protein
MLAYWVVAVVGIVALAVIVVRAGWVRGGEVQDKSLLDRMNPAKVQTDATGIELQRQRDETHRP